MTTQRVPRKKDPHSQNTRATVLHRDLKLKLTVLHDTIQHPLHRRPVKVFCGQVANFNPMVHADREVYFFKDKGKRYRVDLVLWYGAAIQRLSGPPGDTDAR